MTKLKSRTSYGFLVPFLGSLFDHLNRFSPHGILLGTRVDLHHDYARLTPQERQDATHRRACKVETLVLLGLLAECVIYSLAVWVDLPVIARYCILALVAWRCVGIVSVAAGIALFDDIRIRNLDLPRPAHRMASVVRTVLLTTINYIELLFCFGIAYALFPASLFPSPGDWLAGLYFSTVTQLTIGYGDVHPVGCGRLLAGIQGILGFSFGLLILARFIALLPSIKSAAGDHHGGETT